MCRLIQGVGINDVDCPTTKTELVDGRRKVVWRCPYYAKWVSTLERGFSQKYKTKRPTYRNTTVCDEWLKFSEFKKWAIQFDLFDDDGNAMSLDKDIIDSSADIYSPDTCALVPQLINAFVVDVQRGGLKVGVTYDGRYDKPYRASVNNPMVSTRAGKVITRQFRTECEAHAFWKSEKHKLACVLASRGDVSPIISESLKKRCI